MELGWFYNTNGEWADGVVTEATNYYEFVADSTEYSEAVLFSAEDIVTDIKVYALEFQDVDEEGNPIFEQTEIYAQDQITADMSLLVWLTIEGDIPTYGISYMDGNGYVRNYGIAVSGYDGSIELIRY